VDRPTQHTSSQPNRGSRWYHWNSSGGKQWGTLTVEFMGNDLRLIATVDSPRDVPTYAHVSFGDIRWTYATDSRTYQKAKSYLIKDCWSRESFTMNEWVMRYAVKAKWENKKKSSPGNHSHYFYFHLGICLFCEEDSLSPETFNKNNGMCIVHSCLWCQYLEYNQVVCDMFFFFLVWMLRGWLLYFRC